MSIRGIPNFHQISDERTRLENVRSLNQPPERNITEVTVHSFDLDDFESVTLPQTITATHVKVDTIIISSSIPNIIAPDNRLNWIEIHTNGSSTKNMFVDIPEGNYDSTSLATTLTFKMNQASLASGYGYAYGIVFDKALGKYFIRSQKKADDTTPVAIELLESELSRKLGFYKPRDKITSLLSNIEGLLEAKYSPDLSNLTSLVLTSNLPTTNRVLVGSGSIRALATVPLTNQYGYVNIKHGHTWLSLGQATPISSLNLKWVNAKTGKHLDLQSPNTSWIVTLSFY